MIDDRLMTCPEVAEYLHVTEKAVRRWVEQRRLPYIKLGRMLRFRRSVLDNFLAKRQVRAINSEGSELIG